MFLDRIIAPKGSFPKEGDQVRRSALKALTWRLLGTLDTFVISWLITDNLSTATLIGSVEIFSKMLLYFIHERIWNRFQWGK